MSPTIADVTGPHRRASDAITFRWLERVKPWAIGLVFATATVVGGWYKVQALDAAQTARADAVKVEQETQRKRLDALEEEARRARVETQKKLDDLRNATADTNAKLDRVLCKLLPADCKP